MFRVIAVLSLLILNAYLFGQNTVSLIVADSESKEGIADVHAFFINSTIGTFTDDEGRFNINIDQANNQALFLSHLGYKNRSISALALSDFTSNDTLLLESTGVDLSSIIITADKNRAWKKNYKKFRNAFIGDVKEAKNVEIINAEMLQFEKDDDLFRVTCPVPLELINKHLGYEIIFHLELLEIKKNGSAVYKGSAVFKDIAFDNKKIIRNREKAFKNSLSHFLRSTISNNWTNDRYEVKWVNYKNGNFETQKDGLRSKDILVYNKSTQLYDLYFPAYLEVTNKRSKTFTQKLSQSNSLGKEQSKYGNNGTVGGQRINYAQSLLYKIDTTLQVNNYGQIVNSDKVMEYGVWAQQKMALTLPWNYKEPLQSLIYHTKEQEKLEDANLTSLAIAKIFNTGSRQEREELWKRLDKEWDEAYLAILLDILRLSDATEYQDAFLSLCKQKKTDQIKDYYSGLKYIWNKEPQYDASYADAKALIYKLIDPKFSTYFSDRHNLTDIRLDEIVWGGVLQDGIPPLRNPKMIPVDKADYLEDDNVIFGMVIDGIARAYPKRILAWHEMFLQDYDNKSIAGVYCTLCGTVIAYQQNNRDTIYNMGTSGFLYRSNKLMYDRKTQSLWNTITGKPVLGPLISTKNELLIYPVITTTWKEWKAQHPESEVLSIDTGYDRDYGEGVAYKDYFSTDRLMFPTPFSDNKLDNKQEVFIPRTANYEQDPIAISTDYLLKNRIHHTRIHSENIVIITDHSGASRAYNSESYRFKKRVKSILIGEEDHRFEITDAHIISKSTNVKLARVPSHRSFWFAWINQYPNTRVVY